MTTEHIEAQRNTNERERRGVHLSMRLPQSVHAELRRLADADDRTVSSYVYRLISQNLTERSKTGIGGIRDV